MTHRELLVTRAFDGRRVVYGRAERRDEAAWSWSVACVGPLPLGRKVQPRSGGWQIVVAGADLDIVAPDDNRTVHGLGPFGSESPGLPFN